MGDPVPPLFAQVVVLSDGESQTLLKTARGRELPRGFESYALYALHALRSAGLVLVRHLAGKTGLTSGLLRTLLAFCDNTGDTHPLCQGISHMSGRSLH